MQRFLATGQRLGQVVQDRLFARVQFHVGLQAEAHFDLLLAHAKVFRVDAHADATLLMAWMPPPDGIHAINRARTRPNDDTFTRAQLFQ